MAMAAATAAARQGIEVEQICWLLNKSIKLMDNPDCW
jgi:hypothetical protein